MFRTKRFAALAITLGTALSACGHLGTGSAPQGHTSSKPDDPSTQCLSATPTLTRHPPNALYLSAAQCIEQNRLDEAALLYAVAGSQSRFDTRRVVDTTAHQVANFLGLIFSKHIGDDASAALSAHMRSTLDDVQARQAFCHTLKQLPPPSYRPDYMINHGMQAFTSASEDNALMDLPDANKAWASSVNEYMDCVD